MRRLVFATSALLGACSLAPPLSIPDVPMAAGYKEAAPWTAARPADALPREAWWTMYGDGELDALQATLVRNSPDLAAALARYQQAQAVADQARSGLLPTVSGNANVQRIRQSELRPLRVLGPTSPDQYSRRRPRHPGLQRHRPGIREGQVEGPHTLTPVDPDGPALLRVDVRRRRLGIPTGRVLKNCGIRIADCGIQTADLPMTVCVFHSEFRIPNLVQ